MAMTEMPMRAGDAAPEETEREEISVFIPAAALGGRECEVGDSLTLEVRSIDPETGEVEARVGGSASASKRPSRMDEAIDAMPEEDSY